MRPPKDIDKEKLKAKLRNLLEHSSSSEARAEERAVQSGTLDQDDRTSLRVIEGKFEHMATKAELTAAVRQLEASIARLRNWAPGHGGPLDVLRPARAILSAEAGGLSICLQPCSSGGGPARR